MMTGSLMIVFQIINLTVIPLLLTGLVRKMKALMQNRVGAPILQAFYDMAKFSLKTETISSVASWVFVWAPRAGFAIAALAAALVPWAGALLPAQWSAATNFLLVLYLMALSRFLSLLAATDTGSAFGGLGASREATISMLVEPIFVVGFGALALRAGSTDLLTIYSTRMGPLLAILVGASLFVAALAELSRMPVDDPTTHLELTMVHEAMILEYSGRSLAMIEYAVALRSCLYLGLAAQTLLLGWPGYVALPLVWRYASSVVSLLATGIVLAVAEGVLVKLKWRSVPHFLAFAAVMSLLAALVAVVEP